MEERVQKILARVGFGSRRACEDIIRTGRVLINGTVAQLGDRADLSADKISVDGRQVSAPEPLVYIALYKPRYVLTTSDTKDDRATILDLVNVNERIYPVGRLDYDSEGLILMTNDGELANHLTHPRYGHEKEYSVLVSRRPDEKQLETWRRGVILPDGFKTAPAVVEYDKSSGDGAWLRIILREGHKREIRETANQIGLVVVRLIRTRIGNLTLGRLKPKEWRYLSVQEIKELKNPRRPSVRPKTKQRAPRV